MTNVLFVSIAFPPKNDPECLQTAKYFKYLATDRRLSISVVTSSIPTLNMSYDEELLKYTDGYAQQISIPVYETKATNFLLRKILPGGIEYPDSKFSFHLQSNKVKKKLKVSPDVIYSRSNPLSSAFLALKLKRYYKVPWIMHLSDPWVGSPVHPYKGLQLAFHRKWQNACFSAADFISLTSEKTIEFYSKEYPEYRNKFKLFPNVYDPDDIRTPQFTFGEKLRIIYTGGLAGQRSPIHFINACRELFSEFPSLAKKFEIIFAGPMDKVNREIFEQSDVPAINHIGNLSYNQAQQLIQSAHALLTIDLPIDNAAQAMFFPSKILDYFLTQRKILALTTPGSATWMALQDRNAILLPLRDAGGIKRTLTELLREFEARHVEFFMNEKIPQEYDAKANGSKLAELICACSEKSC